MFLQLVVAELRFMGNVSFDGAIFARVHLFLFGEIPAGP